jgi:hypothetical protein
MAAGVTAHSLDEALELVHRGFYENRELPPVANVSAGVDRAPGAWAPFAPAPSGEPGIWHPEPLFPTRTVVAKAVVPEGWPPIRRRRRSLTLLLTRDDLEALGTEIITRRPTARFRVDGSPNVSRELPSEARTLVQIGDAVLHPGYDRNPPDLQGALEVRLDAPLIVGEELRSSELVVEVPIDDEAAVDFVDAVFEAAKQSTAARLERLPGLRENSKVRIGSSADAWWRAADERRLRHRSVASIQYRVRGSP